MWLGFFFFLFQVNAWIQKLMSNLVEYSWSTDQNGCDLGFFFFLLQYSSNPTV